MHQETALNFCMEHDQHTLRDGEGQEITELAGGGALRQEFNSSEGKFKAFLGDAALLSGPSPVLSRAVWCCRGVGRVCKTRVQVPTGYPFFILRELHFDSNVLPERRPATSSALLPSLLFSLFVLNIFP